MKIAALLLLALMVCLPVNSVFSQRQERDVPAEIDSDQTSIAWRAQSLESRGRRVGRTQMESNQFHQPSDQRTGRSRKISRR
jgi:hypothetical protein